MLAIEQRCCADQRTLGELFRYAVDELRDITLAEALLYLMEQFAACFEAAKDGSTDVVPDLLDDFVSKLPKGVQHMLKCMAR